MPRIGKIVKQWALTGISRLRRHYSATSTTFDEEARILLKKQVDLLYRGFLPGAIGTLLISVFFAAAMWQRAETAILTGWLATVWIITLMRGLLVARFFRKDPAADALRPWINYFVLGAAAAGGIWGLTAFLFISGSDDIATMLVVFFVAGVSAAGTAVFAPVLPAVAAFLMAALLPLSLRLLQLEDSAYLFMGAATVVYLAVLLSTSRRGHTVIWNTMQTTVMNERLREAIKAEKALADEREKTVARLTTLERENELFRNMVERSTNFVILVQDGAEQGKIIYANDAACKHFGTDRESLMRWTPFDFDPHFDTAAGERIFANLMAGESVTFESEHRRANGELIPVEVVLHPLVQDGKIRCVTYIHDIRQRKEMEAQRLQLEATVARQEIEDRYRSLVEALPDFVVRMDTQARYLYLSPLVLQKTGRDENEFLGKTALEIGMSGSHEGDKRLFAATMQAINSGEASVYRDWGALPGRRICLEIRNIPDKNDAGEVESVLVIARDITEQAEIEDALEFVAQRGWSQDGEPFHTALVRYLGKTLNVDYAIVDRLADEPDEVETVAIYAKDKILPNLHYSLKGTPCEDVINGGLCFYASDVRRHFPDDMMLSEMGVESYIGMPLWDSTGQVIGLIMVMDSKPIEDETAVTSLLQLVATRVAAELERERSERALKAREQEYRRLLEDSPDIIIRYDLQCRRIYHNAAHQRVLLKPVSIGKTPAEDWGVPTGIEVANTYQAHLCHVMESGMPDEWELSWHDADGNLICFLVRATPEFDQHDEVVGVMVVGRDITARKHLEAATIAREQEFRALADNSPDFITRFDKNGRRTYINPSLAMLLDAERTLGKTPTEYYPDSAEAEEYEARIRYVLETGEESQFVFNFPDNNGRHYSSDTRIVPERNGSGEIVGVLAIGRDISERLHLEDKLRRQASYDALTGLPNRWSFGDRLREEITKAERNKANVALLFIDLDRFKEVNDTLGHERCY